MQYPVDRQLAHHQIQGDTGQVEHEWFDPEAPLVRAVLGWPMCHCANRLVPWAVGQAADWITGLSR